MRKGYRKETCWECGKVRDNCRAAASFPTEGGQPTFVWVCPECWRDLNYDKYVTAKASNGKFFE